MEEQLRVATFPRSLVTQKWESLVRLFVEYDHRCVRESLDYR